MDIKIRVLNETQIILNTKKTVREIANLSVFSSCVHFVSWAITAVLRRI